MQIVVRQEEKYPMAKLEALKYTDMFLKLLKSDEHSLNGDYSVRSLYFDTVDDKDFFDKINEQNLRRKIRLRIYHPSDDYAKLEMKQKENIYQKKRSLIITRHDAVEMIRGNYAVLLKYNDDFACEMFAIMNEECYRPKAIVEYDRRAFIATENNIRLTFDSNIRASETNLNIFDKNLILNPVYDLDKVVFEVKYDRFMLGYISDIISNVDKRKISSSKYCLSRSIAYPLY